MLIGLLLLMFVIGCAGERKITKNDNFFEKWNTLAENSQGHSPGAKPKKINMDPKFQQKNKVRCGTWRNLWKAADQTHQSYHAPGGPQGRPAGHGQDG